MSEFSKWLLATFPPASDRGQGLGRLLGDQGCQSDLVCSTSLPLACVDTDPRGAATVPLALLRGVRAGRALPTSSPTSQDPSWGHTQGDTKGGVCVSSRSC